MGNPRCQFTISHDPIPAPAGGGFDPSGATGADVQFLGTVRGEEGGRAISGIEYTAYLPMAEKLLANLRAEAEDKFGPHPVRIHHRLGFVPAGEPSIVIRVATKHSPLAFEICAWYLRAIKTTVPIWKDPVFA